ncbi:MAG: rRNA pseudouridine synthase [Solirubrobacterales bacterium]|nr:rRNA pseudouridine synthase [Solirubrobacterales bacterium]
MRLAKYLAHSGVASRRAAEGMIGAGRVSVGGERVTDPARDVDESSGVTVDGNAVAPEPLEVWALNKPTGVVSTAKEPGSRLAVTDLVDSERRLYPVGRLDADSTGLLLLTNNGELANRLTHPRYGVSRVYRVHLRRAPAESDLEALRSGVTLEDGPTSPARVERIEEREIEVTLGEGRKRQLRRMAEAVGNEVEALERVRIGSLELGGLEYGSARRLSDAEIGALWEDARSMETGGDAKSGKRAQ